jgi:hypothetical protein
MPSQRPRIDLHADPSRVDAMTESASLRMEWRPSLSAVVLIAGTSAPPVAAVTSPAAALGESRSSWRRAATLVSGAALAMMLVIGGAQWSSAQRRDAPRIVVAPTIVAEPASQAPLIIQVSPLEGLPDNSFLRLRGFPSSVSLTEGHAIAPGAWAIPLLGLASLKAIVPAGVSGRNEISITLVGVDGRTLAESKTALVIAAPTPPERVQPEPKPRVSPPLAVPGPAARAAAPPPGPAADPDISGEERARAERMMAQGSRHLDQGNISAARMFFQRAAEAGLAAAAISMGATYDPAELSRGSSALAGVVANRNEARRWYELARDLGAPDANERLGRLGSR